VLLRDRILLVLHESQNRSPRSFLEPAELEEIRRRFGLTKAEIRGIATYYSLFSLAPRGRHVIRLCVSPVCRMLGSLDLLAFLKQELGIELGQTTGDGLFTLEETQCLGRCPDAPCLMVDKRNHGGLTPRRIKGILDSLRRTHAAGRAGRAHGIGKRKADG
jgi:NADH:ubiquinone oxidoreductase subunit E